MSADLSSQYIGRLNGRRRIHPLRFRITYERSRAWMFHNGKKEIARIFDERDAARPSDQPQEGK